MINIKTKYTEKNLENMWIKKGKLGTVIRKSFWLFYIGGILTFVVSPVVLTEVISTKIGAIEFFVLIQIMGVTAILVGTVIKNFWLPFIGMILIFLVSPIVLIEVISIKTGDNSLKDFIPIYLFSVILTSFIINRFHKKNINRNI